MMILENFWFARTADSTQTTAWTEPLSRKASHFVTKCNGIMLGIFIVTIRHEN